MSLVSFSEYLGKGTGLTPPEKQSAPPPKKPVYLDAGTCINRVIKFTDEHTGTVVHRGKPLKVVEVYNPITETFSWVTTSYACDCQKQGYIVFW